MKKLNSLYAAGALVLLANAFTLVHVARNRSGPAAQEITLSDRELHYFRDKDDSGVHLMLQHSSVAQDWRNPVWLHRERIRALGFDCSMDPGEPRSYDFYNRQRPRTAFVAFEYDGPAWQAAVALVEEADRANSERRQGSRLVPVDAAADAAALLARVAGRDKILILPAVVRVHAEPGYPAQANRPARPARLGAFIVQIPSDIHVPKPFSDGFRGMTQTPQYRVTLRYGQFLEPWVAAVEFSR